MTANSPGPRYQVWNLGEAWCVLDTSIFPTISPLNGQGYASCSAARRAATKLNRSLANKAAWAESDRERAQAAAAKARRAAAILGRRIMAEHLLIVFDAPLNLMGAFRDNGFRPYGKQPGAWCRSVPNPDDEEARDLEYELKAVGLAPRWRERS